MWVGNVCRYVQGLGERGGRGLWEGPGVGTGQVGPACLCTASQHQIHCSTPAAPCLNPRRFMPQPPAAPSLGADLLVLDHHRADQVRELCAARRRQRRGRHLCAVRRHLPRLQPARRRRRAHLRPGAVGVPDRRAGAGAQRRVRDQEEAISGHQAQECVGGSLEGGDLVGGGLQCTGSQGVRDAKRRTSTPQAPPPCCSELSCTIPSLLLSSLQMRCMQAGGCSWPCW